MKSRRQQLSAPISQSTGWHLSRLDVAGSEAASGGGKRQTGPEAGSALVRQAGNRQPGAGLRA